MTPADEILIPHDAARYLRVSIESLRRAVQRGDLKAAKLGRLVRYRRTWLDQWAERQAQRPRRPVAS